MTYAAISTQSDTVLVLGAGHTKDDAIREARFSYGDLPTGIETARCSKEVVRCVQNNWTGRVRFELVDGVVITRNK